VSPVLEAKALVKSYRAPSGDRLEILRGVDLTLSPGELAVVVGPSGCGKSTLLNVLGLLEDADAGDLRLGGESVAGLGRSALARARGRLLGFVFQSFLLLPSLTAFENVLLAARYVGADRASARRRAGELLAELGLGARRDHYPPQLSGGEQQRVAFCRAVLNDPPLLLADEPTGSLDDANGRVILGLLRTRAAGGAAVLVVTHRDDVVRAADSVWGMEDGILTGRRS
jgi:ABC-type lipoprotein export system ATPase subunit